MKSRRKKKSGNGWVKKNKEKRENGEKTEKQKEKITYDMEMGDRDERVGVRWI